MEVERQAEARSTELGVYSASIWLSHSERPARAERACIGGSVPSRGGEPRWTEWWQPKSHSGARAGALRRRAIRRTGAGDSGPLTLCSPAARRQWLRVRRSERISSKKYENPYSSTHLARTTAKSLGFVWFACRRSGLRFDLSICCGFICLFTFNFFFFLFFRRLGKFDFDF